MSKSKKTYGSTSSIYKSVFLKMKQNKESEIIDMINKEMNEESSTTDTPPLLDENEIVPESDSSLSPEPVFRKRNHARKCKKKVTKVSLYDEIDLSEDPEENYQPIFKVVPSSSTSQGDKVRGRKSKRKVKTTTLRNPTVLNEIDLTHDLEGNYEPSFKPDEPSSSKSLLSKNDSFNLDDEVEEEFKIIAMWKTVEKNTFMIRKHQKLMTIFEHYAQKNNVSLDRIYFFTLGNQPICPEDTPNSLNFFRIEHIEGGVLHKSENINTESSKKIIQKSRENMLQLKLLIKDQRKPILVYMDKKEKMKSIMLQGAEELKKSIDELKFHFDGDLINPSDTPEDLDLEGGEVIEITIKS